MSNRAKIILPILLIGVISTLAFTVPTMSHADASPASPLLTPTPSIPMEQTTPAGPPLSLTISLLCFCIVLLLILGVFVLGIAIRRKGGSAGDQI